MKTRTAPWDYNKRPPSHFHWMSFCVRICPQSWRERQSKDGRQYPQTESITAGCKSICQVIVIKKNMTFLLHLGDTQKQIMRIIQ